MIFLIVQTKRKFMIRLNFGPEDNAIMADYEIYCFRLSYNKGFLDFNNKQT